MKGVCDWLDNRTGYRRWVAGILSEPIPGGARWRYVWSATLLFGLVVQCLTGLALWMVYSPSTHTAWESVYHIQENMWGGWWVRGLHYFTAEVMIVLLVLHFMQVLVAGAYRAPREITFWLGLGLGFVVLAEILTGYMLPWDQRGYQAVRVETSLLALTPVIGPYLKQIIIGGTEIGHHTLTRLTAIHAGVLPGLLLFFVFGHVYLSRRHGRAGLGQSTPSKQLADVYWPAQAWRDAVACLAVLAAVLFLVLRHHGTELLAPADPSDPYAAARPPWFMLFLFQFLKWFPGGQEVWGAVVIPGLALLVILLMPWLGRWQLGHRFNLGFAGALAIGIGLLTWLAFSADRNNPEFQRARQAALRDAVRVKELAASPHGIPVGGAALLLRQDPVTQGPKLFARHCASCHRYDGHDGTGHTPADPQSAADLKGYGSVAWLTGLFDPEQIVSTNYFGGTRFANGKMVRFVKRDVADFDAAQQEMLRKIILALAAEKDRPAASASDTEAEAGSGGETAAGTGTKAETPKLAGSASGSVSPDVLVEGRKLIDDVDMRCTECHDFHGVNDDPEAPTLTGYASRTWLVEFIANPSHDKFYGRRNDRMPAYGEEQILTEAEISLVAEWLLR